MLSKIITFSIRNKLIVGLFVLALIGYGLYETSKLPIDAVPDITNNQVQIITTSPSLGASDIERLITFPIEQANNNIPGLKEQRSFSRFGLSVVTLVFDDDVDLYWARQQISERLQSVKDQIPKGFGTPSLAPVTTGLGEIYQYTVRAKKGYEKQYSETDLRTIQDWLVRKQLLGVQGVAEVSSFGGLLKQYEVAVEPGKLIANNLSVTDVFSALEKNNENIGGAYIEKGPTVLYIRSEGLTRSLEDIEQIVVRNLPNGNPLLIRDIAQVNFGHAIQYGAMTYNGEDQVSGAVVMMLKGANSNQVIKNVKKRIREIQKTLPEGVVIDAFLDRTKMVNNAIGTVSKNLLEGALIVIFVLVLFLGNVRAGLLVASVIPLSMLFAVILMNAFGVSGNLMSLGALDFGLIVDGAVIIVEAVLHSFLHSKKYNGLKTLSQAQMDSEVQGSASRMMNSAVFGQVIILMVYLPIFTLQGIEGKMFMPMAQTVAFALIGAFVLSLTYIPMMSSFFLSKKIDHKATIADKMMAKLERVYQKYLLKVFRAQKAILVIILLLFATSVLVLTKLGGEFIPSLPEGDFAVETRVLPGSSLKTSVEAVSKASKILLNRFPEIEQIVAKTGSSEVPTDPMPIDASDLIIVLKPRQEWTSAHTYGELESKMSSALSEIPGVTFGFQFPVAMRFNELISGARQDVVCKIYGENLDTLSAYAQKLGRICASVNGTTGLYVESVSGMPQLVIDYNRVAIAEFGLTIKEVNAAVNASFAGQSAGLVYEGEKRFDLVVRMAQNQRNNLEDLQNLPITTPNGTQIPLQAVAKVAIVESSNQIQRENSQRRIVVGFNARGRDIQSLVEELQQKVDKSLPLPAGYSIHYGGAFENLNAARDRLMIAVPLSLVLIFLMLYFAFGSLRQGLLIYTAIPLSAIGGILALSVRDLPFSISAGVGFIALFGVAVLNGIVLLAEFNRLRKEGLSDPLLIIFRGTRSRLRPVLMTAFVASLGFFPMAFSTGEGAEVQRPLASVVIGGLLVATFLTLFVLPLLYVWNERKSKRRLNLNTNVLILLFGLLVPALLPAQSPISLPAALDSAFKNNLGLKNQQLMMAYRKQLIETNSLFAPTTVNTEYGQINSFYQDKKVGISQAIKFPGVYKSQQRLLTLDWEQELTNGDIQQKELEKQVSLCYYQLMHLVKKKALLVKADSLFQSFEQKAALRFTSGESNLLEKSVSENQRAQITIQFNELLKDIETVQLELSFLLNTTTRFVPETDRTKYPEPRIIYTDQHLELHPLVALFAQKKKAAELLVNYERSKYLPELFLGYSVMGMRGTGANDVVYDSRLQFQSFNVGLSLPILPGGRRASVKAAMLNVERADLEYEQNLQAFKNNSSGLRLKLEKYNQSVYTYETVLLINAGQMAKTANEQFANGDINYLEWVISINQAISIESDYLDALKSRNFAAIELNSLLFN